jgi:hypothetical protein
MQRFASKPIRKSWEWGNSMFGGSPSGLSRKQYARWRKREMRFFLVVMIGIPLVVCLICGLVKR